MEATDKSDDLVNVSTVNPIVNKLEQDYELESGQELRLEFEDDSKVTIELLSGSGEIFGAQMEIGKQYKRLVSQNKLAVYTWHGCKLRISGYCRGIDTTKDTPMEFYAKIHGGLETMRETAESQKRRGPVAIIVGPCDVGKSTLSRILCNYATKKRWTPVYVDLDPGQTNIGLPGTIGLTVVAKSYEAEDTVPPGQPILLHYGFLSPRENLRHFNKTITRSCQFYENLIEKDGKAKHSGCIINTCGWVSGGAYRSIIHAAATYKVDVIIIIGDESLYEDINKVVPSCVKVILAPKSSGVFSRQRKTRILSRFQRIKSYFHGGLLEPNPITPYKLVAPLSHLKYYKVINLAHPDPNLNGAFSYENDLISVGLNTNHNDHLLALSLKTDPNVAINSHISGFYWITDVNLENQTVTLLSRENALPPTGSIVFVSDYRIEPNFG